ncbi:hypothetical protein STAS_04508 [Striga asiatica]|uniref:Uncharacterized protein n=1 Tax=Striga asiatica TaxID=4170 RepID=A0A5A7P7C0_STRAF|nr:hypothetical protein STAS_04508 [Striga asiatica]
MEKKDKPNWESDKPYIQSRSHHFQKEDPKEVREEQWEFLERAKGKWGDNWVIGGDWNEIMEHSEKKEFNEPQGPPSRVNDTTETNNDTRAEGVNDTRLNINKTNAEPSKNEEEMPTSSKKADGIIHLIPIKEDDFQLYEDNNLMHMGDQNKEDIIMNEGNLGVDITSQTDAAISQSTARDRRIEIVNWGAYWEILGDTAVCRCSRAQSSPNLVSSEEIR